MHIVHEEIACKLFFIQLEASEGVLMLVYVVAS